MKSPKSVRSERMSIDNLPTRFAPQPLTDFDNESAPVRKKSLSKTQTPPTSEVKRNSGGNILRSVLSRGRDAVRSIVDATKFNFEDFTEVQEVGKGACSEVYVAKHKPTGRTMAVKEINKRRAAESGRVRAVLNEKEVLKTLTQHGCPFIAPLVGGFTDEDNVYFVLQFCPGGELYSYIQANQSFPIAHAKFYMCEILLALHHMHTVESIVYRDLKPENILMDAEGHIALIDFGYAKKLKPNERTYTACGTLDYMAPEVIMCAAADAPIGYGFSADYWSLGVILYEMIVGVLPFPADTRMEIVAKIVVGKFSIPASMDQLTMDLIARLLNTEPTQRLGANGIQEIMEHPWFHGVDWVAIRNKQIPAPFQPQLESSDDTNYFRSQLTNDDLCTFAFGGP